jgi:hypothetical protein
MLLKVTCDSATEDASEAAAIMSYTRKDCSQRTILVN